MADNTSKAAKVLKPQDVFTPGWPIKSIDLFRGRVPQIRRLLDTIESPGRHPVLFGQRGVGKTSLVNLLELFDEDTPFVRVTCDSSDTFEAIWRRALDRTYVAYTEPTMGLVAAEVEQAAPLSLQLNGHPVTPAAVAGLLEQVKQKTVVILDEFDQVVNESAKKLTADLIKHVSDNIELVTLVIVGVGGSITDLIGAHPSIERNLAQIEMPKMSAAEITEILTNGFDRLFLEVQQEVLTEAANLSDGFPNYAHLLGLSAARACGLAKTKLLTLQLFESTACGLAIEEADETYRQKFLKATRTQQSSRHAHVFCACALASHDEEGVFGAGDIAEAMRTHFGMEAEGKRLTPTLKEFCGEGRGPALAVVKVGKANKYRFADPMMRPWLRVRAKAYRPAEGHD